MRVLFVLACLLVLAACRDDAPAALNSAIDPSDFGAAEARCAQDGGRWVALADSGPMVCLRNTPDGGRACSAATDCSSACLARSRTCAPVTPLFGCNEVLGVDGARSTVCLQ